MAGWLEKSIALHMWGSGHNFSAFLLARKKHIYHSELATQCVQKCSFEFPVIFSNKKCSVALVFEG